MPRNILVVLCSFLSVVVVLLDSSHRVLVQHQPPFGFGMITIPGTLWPTSSSFGIADSFALLVSDATSMLSERATMLVVVCQHLLRAHQRMKHRANKRRSERTFNLVDLVYLRLQPYV
jgi:hypothetical protein